MSALCNESPGGFRELHLGLKVAASFDRNESYQRTIDGQIRCISRPRGSVGVAALLCCYGSIPRWSASKTQDRTVDPPKGNQFGQKKMDRSTVSPLTSNLEYELH